MGFKFNPFTGTLDLVGGSSSASDDLHSGYYYVGVSETVTVAQYKQSVTFGAMIVDGALVVDGQLILEP